MTERPGRGSLTSSPSRLQPSRRHPVTPESETDLAALNDPTSGTTGSKIVRREAGPGGSGRGSRRRPDACSAPWRREWQGPARTWSGPGGSAARGRRWHLHAQVVLALRRDTLQDARRGGVASGIRGCVKRRVLHVPGGGDARGAGTGEGAQPGGAPGDRLCLKK